MYSGTKNISSNWHADISRIKSYILDSKGNGFDGDSYPFRKAVQELRQAGYIITRNKQQCNYKLID
jgi:hypothetical protein